MLHNVPRGGSTSARKRLTYNFERAGNQLVACRITCFKYFTRRQAGECYRKLSEPACPRGAKDEVQDARNKHYDKN